MSQSEENLERQKRRHKGPLIGYIVIALFVAGAVLWWVFSDEPGAQTLEDEPAAATAPDAD